MGGAMEAAKDLGGVYVLVFKEVWQFGPAAPILPENFGLRMTPGRRNHRVADLSEAERRRLLRWLEDERKKVRFS